MNNQEFQYENKDFWRAVILYGLNTATYKIALGKALISLTEGDQTNISMHELAVKFFDLYQDRVKKEMPQLNQPNRLTVMERIIKEYELQNISYPEAIDRVASEAFNDVIPRFHTVDKHEIPVKFYHYDDKGIVLTDNIHQISGNDDAIELHQELDLRWDLLEAGFLIKRSNYTLQNDIRDIYLQDGYGRKNITVNIPVLNAYQKGICFYCSEEMKNEDVNVDHVIPRQFINHDEIWNLALAHNICNSRKSDALPAVSYINKLIDRNEHFIKSNRPIKHKLISQLGNTEKDRKQYVLRIYDDAKKVLAPWVGIKGYNAETDPFYRSFIRNYINQA